MVGCLLKETGWLVKGLTFDAHESHCYFREALMGHFERLDQDPTSGHPMVQRLVLQRPSQARAPPTTYSTLHGPGAGDLAPARSVFLGDFI